MKRLLLTTCLLAGVIPRTDAGDVLQPVADALRGDWGQIKTDIRYRYEYVDEEGDRQEAHASTLRLRLGYLTPEFHGLQGYVEMEGNWELGLDRYHSIRNRRPYSVVADPQETEFNQGWVRYQVTDGVWVKAGRQRIIHDDHRFIGNVVWRQLEQTYDAVTVHNELLPDAVIEASFLWRVQNVLSRTIDMTSPLLHLTYTGLPFGKIAAYGYWLDYDDASDSAGFTLSTQTYGVRFDGSHPITDRIRGLYHLEYARQMDYQRNPNDFAADYYRLMAGIEVFGVTLKGTVENLTADKGVGFGMPLATLHAFQGWADKFLRTPGNGIRDVYATVAFDVLGARVMGVYHDFRDENGDVRYGEEYDAQVTRKFGPHLSVLLKYAYYNAKGFSTDTQKVWGQVALHF